MNNKKTNKKDSFKHLEDAIYRTPAASANDCTGYMPIHTESNEKSENISNLMNAPTSPPSKRNCTLTK